MVLITFTPTSAGAVITTEKEAFPTGAIVVGEAKIVVAYVVTSTVVH